MALRNCAFPASVVGDPVDTKTGALLERKLEFRLIGPLELSWWRHYDSSQSGQRYSLGWGHAHDLDRILYLGEDRTIYGSPVGQQTAFARLTEDGAQAMSAGYTLRRVSPTRYELRRHGAPSMEFVFAGGDNRARPCRLFDDKGQIRLFHGPDRRLEQIEHSTGDMLVADRTAEGLLSRLVLHRRGGGHEDLLIYEYDAHGNLVATRNKAGHGYRLTYDDANRMVLRVGRQGFTFRYRYDDAGRCVFSAGDANWYGVALDYDAKGLVTKVRRPDGGIWHYRFFPNGKLAEIRGPCGSSTKFLYDDAGLLTHEVDPNANLTTYVHDQAGNAVRKILPTGQVIALPEDKSLPDPLAVAVAANAAEYHFGRLLPAQIRPPDAGELAALGLPSAVLALAELRPYDDPVAARATVQAVKPLGVKWWPAPGRGRIFNHLGKLVAQIDDKGRERRWTYDASGNLETYRDFDGGLWQFDYGKWHLLQGLTTPLGARTRYGYTTNECVASCLDPGETLSENIYDQEDRLVQVRRHGVVRESYTRDAAGNTIAKHASDGRLLLSREMGPGNLLAKRILACGDTHIFDYAKSGRRSLAATKADRVTWTYDHFGNMASDLRNAEGIEASFNGPAKLSQLVYFAKFAVKITQYDDSTLCFIDPAGGRHSVRCHGAGFVVARFANGTEAVSQFDDHGRCVFKHIERRQGWRWMRRYHWSGEGELSRVTDNRTGEILHRYDAAHRLAGRTIEGRLEAYVYDSADNLLAQPGLTGLRLLAGNRLEEANGYAFTYNDRNHIARREGPGGSVDYVYDARDQLVHVRSAEGDWHASYDATGRRTRKTWQGRTTEFYWYGEQLVAERAAGGTLRLYIYADTFALTPLLLVDYDTMESPPESGRVYVVISDQVGAPVAVENATGEQVWHASVAPFGGADITRHGDFDLALRFPGHYADTEIGLHYNRCRHYSPSLGRYLQSDPWGIFGGTNLYAYRTNPLLVADVRGLGEGGEKPCPPPPDDEESPGPARQSIQERIDDGGSPPARALANQDLYEYDPASGQYRRIEGEGASRSSEFPSGYRDSTHDAMAAQHTDEGQAQGGVPVDDKGQPIPRDQLTWRDEDGNQIPYHDEDGNTNLTYDHKDSCVSMWNDGSTVNNPDGTTTTYPPGNNTDRATRNDFYNDPNNLTPMSRSDNSSKGGGGSTYNDNPKGPDYGN